MVGLFVIGMMGGFALGIAIGVVMMIYAEESE